MLLYYISLILFITIFKLVVEKKKNIRFSIGLDNKNIII